MTNVSLHFGERLTSGMRLLRIWCSAGPGILWLIVFFGCPLLCIAVVSFLTRGDYGGVQFPWTFENYRRVAGEGIFGFDPVFLIIFLRSLLLAAGTVALCLCAGLPIAFWIARLQHGWKAAALTFLLIPLWTNLLVRTYAWQILLSPGGWLAGLSSAIGFTHPGESLYPSFGAVYLCMLCDYLPFMALPLYVSVQKIDWRLAEAAIDLGAGRVKVFRHALLPQIKPGIVTGLILVFLPAMGQFVIPDLLGGAKTILLGSLLQQQFGSAADWPYGGAIAIVTLLLVFVFFWRLTRGGRDTAELHQL